MREIKFRVWEKDKQRYMPQYIDDENEDADFNHYGYDIATTGAVIRTDYLDAPSDDLWTRTQSYNVGRCVVLEQYTGLQDKNGKEIYEGDIVVATDKCCICALSNKPQCIEFEGGMFVAGLSCVSLGFMLNYGVEVIGNIHENPELLEEKK